MESTTIFVKTINHGGFDFVIHPSCSLGDVYDVVSDKLNWIVEDFRLIFKGRYITREESIGNLLYIHQFAELGESHIVFWAVLKTTAKSKVYLRIRYIQKSKSLIRKNYSKEKKIKSKTHLVTARQGMSVLQLKTMLNEQNVCPFRAHHQNLIVDGKILKDHQTLGEYTKPNSEFSPLLGMVMYKQSAQSEITLRILLAGGGKYSTHISIQEPISRVKEILVKSNSFAMFGEQFSLYEAQSRRCLRDDQLLVKGLVGEEATLLAVPNLACLTNGSEDSSTFLAGSLGSVASRLVPSPVDLFFPVKLVKKMLHTSNMNLEKKFSSEAKLNSKARDGNRVKNSSRLFGGFKRGFFTQNNNGEQRRSGSKILHSKKRGAMKFMSGKDLRSTSLGKPSSNSRMTVVDVSNQTESLKKPDENDQNKGNLKELRSKHSKNIGSEHKCALCHRKLHIGMEFTGKCHCGRIYCISHLPSVSHNCTFDFKTAEKSKLSKNHLPVVAPKISRI